MVRVLIIFAEQKPRVDFLLRPFLVGAAHHAVVVELLVPVSVSHNPRIFPNLSVDSPDAKPWQFG